MMIFFMEMLEKMSYMAMREMTDYIVDMDGTRFSVVMVVTRFLPMVVVMLFGLATVTVERTKRSIFMGQEMIRRISQ